MSKSWLISRRTVLRGMAAALPLPLLEAMAPSRALGAPAAIAHSAAPVRMGFVYIPNGVIMSDWKPARLGAGYDLPPTLASLKNVQSHVSVLTGLAQDNARGKQDGAGDHARASATFLTGARPYKTAGADIRLGISVDQFAANHIGDNTRLPSLELTTEKGKSAGNCDSGYSCAYQTNISWRGETSPVPAEIDPAAVFARLFGSGDASPEARTARLARRQSVLDLVAEDARALNSRLGKNDQRKLDEFSTAVREIEKRIKKASTQQHEDKARPAPTMERPQGIPKDYAQHIGLMFDLMLLAFQTDQTRIATFLMARDGSNRNFPQIGVTEGHHELSHHRNEQAKIESLKKIDRFYITQFSRFIERMKATPEGEGTLLDNAMIVLGCSISDGNRHAHHDLPVLLAGRGGATIDSGRHIDFGKDVPMCNLYVEMLRRMGVGAERFGDSTGGLRGLTA